MKKLTGLVEKDDVPRALLHTISRLHRMAEESRDQGQRRRASDQVPYGRWVWLSAYVLGRMAERAKGPGSQELKEMRERLVTAEGIRTFGLAARWSELLLRTEEHP